MHNTFGGDNSRYMPVETNDVRRIQLVDRDMRLLNTAIRFADDIVGPQDMEMYLDQPDDLRHAQRQLVRLTNTRKYLLQQARYAKPVVHGTVSFKKRFREDEDDTGSDMKRARLARFDTRGI